MLSYIDVMFGDAISLNNLKERHIQKNFIIYNIKIKGNTLYPILLLIEASLYHIERKSTIRYLMWKNKINNVDDKGLPKIASNSSQNHQLFNRGWHKDA
jgi:hypothetical protein